LLGPTVNAIAVKIANYNLCPINSEIAWLCENEICSWGLIHQRYCDLSQVDCENFYVIDTAHEDRFNLSVVFHKKGTSIFLVRSFDDESHAFYVRSSMFYSPMLRDTSVKHGPDKGRCGWLWVVRLARVWFIINLIVSLDNNKVKNFINSVTS